MLTDVPFETEEEIWQKMAVYEARFINRYTEKDDGYKNCIQKAARHNQVPVIDYDKRLLRRKKWPDRRPYHNLPRYHDNNPGPPFRKHNYWRQDEGQSDYRYKLYQPSATLSSPLNQPDSLIPNPCEVKNSPWGDKEMQDNNPAEQQGPHVYASVAAADNEPEQQVTGPKSISIKEDGILSTHQPPPTDKDIEDILSNASKTTGERPTHKGKKSQKKETVVMHKQGVDRGKADKTTLLPHVVAPSLMSTAQLLNLPSVSPHPNPSGHRTHQHLHQPSPSGHHTQHLHQPSPSGHHTQHLHQHSSPGILIIHGTTRNVAEVIAEEVDAGISKKKKKKKKDKKVKKKEKEKKKERRHNMADVTGEESNGSIDVITVEQSNAEAISPRVPNPISTLPLSQQLFSDEVSAMHKRKKHKKHNPTV